MVMRVKPDDSRARYIAGVYRGIPFWAYWHSGNQLVKAIDGKIHDFFSLKPYIKGEIFFTTKREAISRYRYLGWQNRSYPDT